MNEVWIPVSQALPMDTRRVLFTWVNEAGKRRTALGFYARQCEIEADWGEDSSYEECEDDDDGTMWLMEGWYEDSWVAGYYAFVLGVTHWMHLPSMPQGDA